MEDKLFNYNKVKKKYLRFLTSQEVMSEPFRDKLGQLNKFYLPISKMIAKDYLKKKKTKVIGLAGGQGTGKSTISNILKIILKEAYKLETVIFSIDDFYKTLNERKKISKKINKLFITRGVPGTHDTKMLFQCINNLKKNNFKKMIIPKFDKYKDNKRIWRQKVNSELKKDYNKIFNLIDKLIFLKVPSFKYVFRWRLLQEKKLRITGTGNKTMNDKQIENFVMYYERITKHMLKTLPKTADTVISIDEKHRLKSIKFN